MSTRPKLILYLYNRLFDPVIQSNFWLYVQELLSDPENPYLIHVVTYEDPSFPLTGAQQESVDGWLSQGLEWTALEWHPGTGMRQKLFDVINGFTTTMKLRLRGYKYIVSLNSVAGAFAFLYARLLGMRLYLYQYEPHSEYAIDNGMWSPDSLQFKIMQVLERLSAHYATVISSGTCFMESRLREQWCVKADFYSVPSVANSEKFHFDPEVRERVRQQLGLEGRRVLLYPGKFGDLYYGTEFAWMYRWLLEEDPELHLLIVTPHQDDFVHNLMQQAGVPTESYTIQHSDYSGIQDFYFASDFGIISVPPGPSKKFISNIKVGEYLCSGLPFLVVRGVSEDYLYAENRDVGVVVDDFDEASIKAAWPEIDDYLSRDPDTLRQHCREVGLEYRGFSNLYPRVRSALRSLVGQ